MSEIACLELLRRANAAVTCFGRNFAPPASHDNDAELAALFQLGGLLQAVGALLETRLQDLHTPRLREELKRYRENLLKLRDQLALLQQSARGRRQELDRQSLHYNALQAWCAASQLSG